MPIFKTVDPNELNAADRSMLPTRLWPEIAPDLTPQMIALSDIDFNPVGPKPSPQLVESIDYFGVMQAITVKRQENGRYLCCTGRRRVIASLAVNRLSIPAVILDGDVSPATIQLVDHALRKDNPAAEYTAILALNEAGLSEVDIAKQTGMNIAVVRARLRFGNLHWELLQAFKSGDLAVGVAEAACKLPGELQERLASVYAESGKLTLSDVKSVRQARQATADLDDLDLDDDLDTGANLALDDSEDEGMERWAKLRLSVLDAIKVLESATPQDIAAKSRAALQLLKGVI